MLSASLSADIKNYFGHQSLADDSLSSHPEELYIYTEV